MMSAQRRPRSAICSLGSFTKGPQRAHWRPDQTAGMHRLIWVFAYTTFFRFCCGLTKLSAVINFSDVEYLTPNTVKDLKFWTLKNRTSWIYFLSSQLRQREVTNFAKGSNLFASNCLPLQNRTSWIYFLLTIEAKGSNQFCKGMQFNCLPLQNWLLPSRNFRYFPFWN